MQFVVSCIFMFFNKTFVLKCVYSNPKF